MRVEQDNSITRHPGGGRPNKYQFHTLEPGGCLIIPVEKDDHHKYLAYRVSTALSNWKKRNDADEWVTAVRNTEEEVHVYRFE